MTLVEQVFAQASILADKLEGREQELLKALCAGTVASLTARLRDGMTPEDCKADFIAAASLFALAAMSGVKNDAEPGEVKIGDVTMKRSGADTASKCLYNQAELIISPYLKDRFWFQGV